MRWTLLGLLLVASNLSFSQDKNDSLGKGPGYKDSAVAGNNFVFRLDSINHPDFLKFRHGGLQDLILQNKSLNLATAPVNFIIQDKKPLGKDFLFYTLLSVLLLVAMLKVFYKRYFNTIFRVYFNTSLRQNQLTDILIQEKLPSLIFNILYFLTGAFYAWLVVNYYRSPQSKEGVIFIPFAFLFLSVIYIGKLCVVKFLGWISGSSEAANFYIFIIFLINKIIGILLIPVIVLLAFSPIGWQHILILTSLFLVGILFISRYIRSYDLLKHKLMFRGVHFFLYVIAVEVLPICILIKSTIKMIV